MLKVGKSVSYVKIQDLYIRNNNFVELAWLLLTRTRPFNFHLKAHSKYLRIFSGKAIKVLRIANIIVNLFILKYINSYNKKEIINLPYEGHILIKTSNGYKVFNLKKKIVAIKYKEGPNLNSFNSTVQELNEISNLKVAPKIIKVDFDDKCIYEEFLNLYKSEKFYPFNFYFYDNILPLWNKNVNSYPSGTGKLKEYVESHISLIYQRIELLEAEGYNEFKLNKIRSFINYVNKKLLNAQSSQSNIYLNISHGDFHAWNVLVGRKQTILIDWETSKERSIFHDIFYIFFHVIFSKQNINYGELFQELDHSIEISLLYLIKKNNTYKVLQESNYKEVYRLIFYLEYILLDVEKRLDRLIDKKKIERRIDSIEFCIDTFEEIEKYYNYQNV